MTTRDWIEIKKMFSQMEDNVLTEVRNVSSRFEPMLKKGEEIIEYSFTAKCKATVDGVPQYEVYEFNPGYRFKFVAIACGAPNGTSPSIIAKFIKEGYSKTYNFDIDSNNTYRGITCNGKIDKFWPSSTYSPMSALVILDTWFDKIEFHSCNNKTTDTSMNVTVCIVREVE